MTTKNRPAWLSSQTRTKKTPGHTPKTREISLCLEYAKQSAEQVAAPISKHIKQMFARVCNK